jgi:hypothetical protein
MAASRPACAFIVSTGRTGTQFFGHRLADLIEGCASFHEPGTPWPTRPLQTLRTMLQFGPLRATLGQLTPWYGSYKLSRERVRGIVGDEDAIRWLQQMRKKLLAGVDAPLYVEASGHLYGVSDLLPRAFPGCRVAFVVRDPRTWVHSALRTPEYYLYGPLDETLARLSICAPDLDGDPARERWDTMDKFEKYCWFYALSNRVMSEALAGRADASVWRFEDLFGDGREAMAELLAFLTSGEGAEHTRWSIDNDIIGNKVHSRASVGQHDWSQWTDAQIRAIEHHCRPFMDAHGYGQDAAWRARVDAVMPRARLAA